MSTLRRCDARVVNVVAPAGWGKTTLAAQWSSAESRPVVWISADAHDNDTTALLRYVVAALARVAAVSPSLLKAVGSTRADGGKLLARTAVALRSCPPLLIVIDNADLIVTADARRVLSMLVAEAPAGSTVALLGRADSRVAGAATSRTDVQQISKAELALSTKDAEAVLRSARRELSETDLGDEIQRLEGWPAGLYLASLALAEERDREDALLPTGTDRYLADYVRSEYLGQLRPQELRFVEETSLLETLNARVCDATLQRKDSASNLKRLARLQLTVAEDERHATYRYPRVVREYLAGELAANEPRKLRTLHRRAADWYLGHGDADAALVHAQAAHDPERLAPLLVEMTLGPTPSPRLRAIEDAFMRFEQTYPLDRYPNVAVHGSLFHAFRGRTAAAAQSLASAARGSTPRVADATGIRARIAVVNAALCRRGPRQMLADASAAMRSLPARSPWYPAALHMRGCAALLLGSPEEAEAALFAATISRAAGTETRMMALSQLSLLARDRGDDGEAARFAADAEALAATLDHAPTTAIALTAAASSALRRGSWSEAQELTQRAAERSEGLNDALPWLTVSTRLEIARNYITLKDVASARANVEDAEAILDVRPRLGMLVDRARTLRHEVATAPGTAAAVGGLTPAEQRLVPLLATHLSFREIADELNVSRNTVKTQAISIYRKLGVKGRSEAIAAAQELTVEAQPAA